VPERQRHHLDAFVREFGRFILRRDAADRPLRRFCIVNATRFLRETLADVLAVATIVRAICSSAARIASSFDIATGSLTAGGCARSG
jgi:hypothetical protein